MSVWKTVWPGAVLSAGLAMGAWSGVAGPAVRTAVVAFAFPLAFWGWVHAVSSLGMDPYGLWADTLLILFCTLQGVAYALGIRWVLRSWNMRAITFCLCVLLLHAIGVLLSLGLFGSRA